MSFSQRNILEEVEKGSTRPSRWHIVDVMNDHHLKFFRLQDASRDIEPPMERIAVGARINYFDKSQEIDDWTVIRWRAQFLQACKGASGNYSGLPEFLDFFKTKSYSRSVSEKLSNDEPIVVYDGGGYDDVRELKPASSNFRWGIQNEAHLFSRVFSLVCDVGYTMKALHADGWVLRQGRLCNLRFMRTSRKHLISEFFAIGRMDEPDHDPHRSHLVLRPQFSAPECFEIGISLTPATDVYVLGKLVLSILGVDIDKPEPNEEDVNRYFSGVQDRFRFKVRPELIRTVKLALLRDPQARIQDVGQFLGHLKGYSPSAKSSSRGQRTKSRGANPAPGSARNAGRRKQRF